MTGGAGNDFFVYGKGYGNDTIAEYDRNTAKRDTVRLVGLNRSDVEFSVAGSNYYHLIITILETGETLTIQNAIYPIPDSFNANGIEAIEFADGSVLEWADLEKELFKMDGTEAGEIIQASYLDTIIDAKGGNDDLRGGSGNDQLYSGAGDDLITAGDGNDLLDSGSGSDQMTGGAGADTYLFRPGSGQDTIDNRGGGNDTLKFEDINPAELWFGKSGYHLTIGLIGTTDKVTVSNWFYSANYQIETIEAGDMAVTESQVALMVQAMASAGAPGGAEGQWTDEQREALAPVLASYWQPRA
jgi:Ca2+-binding RTX toxin-like protein